MADSQVPIQHDSLQTTLLCIYFLNFSSSSGLCLPRVIIIIINIIIMAILKCNASRITSHHSSVAETSADKKTLPVCIGHVTWRRNNACALKRKQSMGDKRQSLYRVLYAGFRTASIDDNGGHRVTASHSGKGIIRRPIPLSRCSTVLAGARCAIMPNTHRRRRRNCRVESCLRCVLGITSSTGN